MSGLAWYMEPALQPAPAEGTYFRRKAMRWFDRLPLGRNDMYGASWYDMDGSHQVGAMCHVVIEIDRLRRMHLVECWHARTDVDSAIQALFQIQEGLHIVQLWADRQPQRSITYGPRRWFVEPSQYEQGGIGARINARRVAINQRRINPRDHFRIAVSPLRQAMDIDQAARALQSDLGTGNILLPPDRTPHYGALETELLLWPATPSSSRVAALGLISAAREQIHPGKVPGQASPSEQLGSWRTD